MSDLKKFLIKLLFFFPLILLTLILLVLYFNPGFKQNETKHMYNFSLTDKLQNLRNTPSPKIVFIGGSNLAFGLDSEKISTAFAMHIVNMGVSAGFGLKFMFDSVTDNLEKGDFLILVPEYEQFFNTYYDGESTIFLEGFKQNPLPLDNNQLYNFRYFYRYMIDFIKLTYNEESKTVYNRTGFNAYGDLVSHLADLEKHEIDFSPEPLELQEINFKFLKYLDNQIKKLETKGIRVFFIYPDFPYAKAGDEPTYSEFDTILRKNLSCTFVCQPQDFMFPADFFYDTPYHLNAKGRAVRTEKVIDFLKPYFED